MNTQDEIKRLETVIAGLTANNNRVTLISKKALKRELEAKIVVLKFIENRSGRRANPCGWGRMESRIDKFAVDAQ